MFANNNEIKLEINNKGNKPKFFGYQTIHH